MAGNHRAMEDTIVKNFAPEKSNDIKRNTEIETLRLCPGQAKEIQSILRQADQICKIRMKMIKLRVPLLKIQF